MVKQKKIKPIIVEVINPEALAYASEIVTQYFYKKYLEMKSTEKLDTTLQEMNSTHPFQETSLYL